VSAESWLNGAVQRAVAIGDPARYPELVGAVEALAACRAVSDEVARDARHRLDDTFAGQATPSPPDARPSGRAPWRAEHRFTPGAPSSASRLTVAVERGDHGGGSAELELPPDR